MYLSQRRCCDCLDLPEAGDAKVDDESFERCIHVTHVFQRRVNVSRCKMLSPGVFEQLGRLRDLWQLDISATRVLDIGALANCTELWNLNVSYTEIASLVPLANCAKLKVLNARHCSNITSLEGLESCPELEWLDAGTSNIEDVSPLGSCSALRTLYLDCTGIVSVEALLNCAQLQFVNVGFTPAQDTRIDGVHVERVARVQQWFSAVAAGNVDVAVTLLEKGQDVNERAFPHPEAGDFSIDLQYDRCSGPTRLLNPLHPDPLMRPTALHYVASFGDEDMVALLIKHKASPHLKAWFGFDRPCRRAQEHFEPDIAADCFNIIELCLREHHYRDQMLQKRVLNWLEQCQEKHNRLECLLKDTEFEKKLYAMEGFGT